MLENKSNVAVGQWAQMQEVVQLQQYHTQCSLKLCLSPIDLLGVRI